MRRIAVVLGIVLVIAVVAAFSLRGRSGADRDPLDQPVLDNNAAASGRAVAGGAT